ncbi:hypothetical protein PENSPDRAFT_758072, partial [Peniophora sp. CONT]
MTSESSYEPDDLDVMLDSAREAADAGTLLGAQVLQLFQVACLLRAEGPLVRKERNIFAESTKLFTNWAWKELYDPSPESWTTILDIQLDVLMHAVLMCEHFLEEDLAIIGAFFETFERIIARLHRLSHEPNGEREIAAVQRVAACADDACEFLWAHRQSLSALWTPGTRTDLDSLRGAYILPLYIKEAIIDTFGPDLFFERVLQDIELEGISGRYRAALLQCLCLPGLHPLMISSFKKHRGLDAAAAVLDKYGTDPDDETRALICSNASILVHKCVAEYFLRQDLLYPLLIVDGSLLVSTLTRDILLVADNCPKLEQKEKKTLCELIQSYTRLLEAREHRSHARTFKAQIKTNARIEWWPNLARLQAAHYHAKEDQLLRLILRVWGGFGIACGLNEEKERRRHRREGRSFCSWTACKYSTQKPPGNLRLCQACGEAQYCERECQKRDWNQG